MPRSRPARAIAVMVAVGAALTGCTSGDDDAEPSSPVVQLGAPGEEGEVLSEDEARDIEAPGYTDTDVAFVQDMILHHEQALAMTALVADRTSREDLPLMAERMDVSQRDEIDQMRAWLADRGENYPGRPAEGHDHGGGADPMPGMLTESEFARLEAAGGPEFDQLFLEFMIRHHEGAIVMVEQLLSSGDGGQEPAVFSLAGHIDGDQRVEISRMRGLLGQVDGS